MRSIWRKIVILYYLVNWEKFICNQQPEYFEQKKKKEYVVENLEILISDNWINVLMHMHVSSKTRLHKMIQAIAIPI